MPINNKTYYNSSHNYFVPMFWILFFLLLYNKTWRLLVSQAPLLNKNSTIRPSKWKHLFPGLTNAPLLVSLSQIHIFCISCSFSATLYCACFSKKNYLREILTVNTEDKWFPSEDSLGTLWTLDAIECSSSRTIDWNGNQKENSVLLWPFQRPIILKATQFSTQFSP